VFEDLDGELFPDATRRWLDCWKRPGEMLLGDTKLEVLELERMEVGGQKLVGGASGRVFRGALYFGHAHFEWLMGVFLMIQQVQSQARAASRCASPSDCSGR